MILSKGLPPEKQNRRPVQGRRLDNLFSGRPLNYSADRTKLKATPLARKRLRAHLMAWPWLITSRREYIVNGRAVRQAVAI